MATLNLLGRHSLALMHFKAFFIFPPPFVFLVQQRKQKSLEDLLTSIDSRRVPGWDQAGTEKAKPPVGKESRGNSKK